METENLARLLAPAGQLSRLEKDAIFARVVKPPWFRRPAVLAGDGLVVAAAIALLVVRPQVPGGTFTPPRSESMTVVVHCGERTPGECVVGDKLMLDFGATPPDGYVALLARSPDGDVIWYSPPADSASIPLHVANGVLDTAVVLDGYKAGTYQLFVVVSDVPLLRAEIKSFARGDDLVAPAGVRIEKRSFTVVP